MGKKLGWITVWIHPESYKKIGGSNISPVIINNGKLYVLIEGSKIIGFE